MEEAGVCVFTHLNRRDCSKIVKIIYDIVEKISNTQPSNIKVAELSRSGPIVYHVPFEAKYYTTNVQFWRFDSLFEFIHWHHQSLIKPNLAIMIGINIEEINDAVFRDLTIIGEKFRTRVLVLLSRHATTTSRAAPIFHVLYLFCKKNGYKLVEYKPDEISKRILKECNMCYGLDFLIQILVDVPWPCRKLKPLESMIKVEPPKQITPLIKAAIFEKCEEVGIDEEEEIQHYFLDLLYDSTIFPPKHKLDIRYQKLLSQHASLMEQGSSKTKKEENKESSKLVYIRQGYEENLTESFQSKFKIFTSCASNESKNLSPYFIYSENSLNKQQNNLKAIQDNNCKNFLEETK